MFFLLRLISTHSDSTVEKLSTQIFTRNVLVFHDLKKITLSLILYCSLSSKLANNDEDDVTMKTMDDDEDSTNENDENRDENEREIESNEKVLFFFLFVCFIKSVGNEREIESNENRMKRYFLIHVLYHNGRCTKNIRPYKLKTQ